MTTWQYGQKRRDPFQLVFIVVLSAMLVSGVAFGRFPCQETSEDHGCVSDGWVTLVAPTNSPVVCLGNSITITASVTVANSQNQTVKHFNNSCPDEVSYGGDAPTYVVTWTASVGGWSTNGTGLTATFTPADCGAGTVSFGLNYTNVSPCNGTGTSSTDGNFTVLSLKIVDGSGKDISSANSNNTAIVGQSMNLTAQTCGGTFSNYVWSVDGYAISNYDVVNGILTTDFPLTNSGVMFHWVDDGSKSVTCSADCGGITCSANVNFNVVKPAAKIDAKTLTVIFTTLGSGGLLKFGGPFGQGITFSNTLTVPASFSGASVWSQVCASAPVFTLTDTSGVTHTTVQNGSSPFGDLPSPYGIFNGVNPFDSPDISVDSSFVGVSASGSYEMFMMFQPSGGCPVPLRAVTWSWSGAFTKSSGVWSGTSTNSIDPPDYPTTSFPTWNSSVKDYHWNPSL